jgi:AcrR family transcriptional regulator
MTAERRKMSRSRILTGARDILDGGVYGDLTVDALARSLHMSKSTLYKYFASKEDVIVALIDLACTESEDALAEVAVDSGSALEALDALVDVLAAHADRVPRAAVLQHSRLPSTCQNRIEVTRATLGRAFRAVMDRGAASGEFQFADGALAATTFMAASHAAMKESARGEFSGTRGEGVRRVYELLLPGMVGQALAAAG